MNKNAELIDWDINQHNTAKERQFKLPSILQVKGKLILIVLYSLSYFLINQFYLNLNVSYTIQFI